MSRLEESILSRVLVSRGVLRREQIEECLAEEPRAGRVDELGKLLLDRGYIGEKDLELVRRIQRLKGRKALRDHRESDRLDRVLGQRALRRGLLSLGDLERGLLEQERLRRLNLNFSLGEVLLTQGSIPAEAVREILAEERRRLLVCPACDDYYQTGVETPAESNRCKRCGGTLQDPAFLDTVSADGVI